jgi:ATP-dependent 26S proteasome regulatory subunit
VEPLAWEEVGGLDEVKARLRRAVEWPLLHAAAFKRFGVGAQRGVLLHGPPGCSKTSLARAAASGTDAAFLYLSGADIFSPCARLPARARAATSAPRLLPPPDGRYVGEAERVVRDFFARGRALAPAILFLDELEAMVGSRGCAGGGGDGDGGVQLRVLSTLLNEVRGPQRSERD